MGYANQGSGDLEKLQVAFREIVDKFGSFENLLEAFGLADMPQAQRYGIMFGCIVFACTITAVVALLVFGGTFQRIAEQAQTGDASSGLTPTDERSQRALLLERLLEDRQRMMKKYPPEPIVPSDQLTPLTKMLLNVAPTAAEGVGDLLDEDAEDNDKENKKEPAKKIENQRYVPPFYQENYVEAYRKCQDRPGGTVLAGRPEARFEAYARGYAGCGPYVTPAYRRSYGRMYEAVCCVSHKSDDKHLELFKKRPCDIVGRHVRLEPLEVKRHLSDFFAITLGEATLERKAFDPQHLWAFWPAGPFETQQEMEKSFVFVRKYKEASFAILNSLTDKLVGVVLLTDDSPENLTIQIEPPIMPPGLEGTQEQLEPCFLLMDRLFGYGYRRIQFSIDSQDVENRQLATRLGFTLEGVLYKHLIYKDANRDSTVYSMLNTDWKQGARTALYKKLHGSDAWKADSLNEKFEEELDEQSRVLAAQKKAEALASKKLD